MKKITITNHANSQFDLHITDGNIEITDGSYDGLSVSDEYHTMSELYDHRRALTAALLNNYLSIAPYKPFKSKLHSDGTMFDGYFICGFIKVGIGKPANDIAYLTYHYSLEHWNEFKIPEVERAPEYDGHTSKDAIERLLKL